MMLPKSDNELVTTEYKCKKCRLKLFTNLDLMSHCPGSGKFDWFTKMSSYKAKQNELNSDKISECKQELFTYYLEWLLNVFDNAEKNDGDIECPNEKCRTKLGRYSLVGEKCTCAKWVCPAFHFHRSKIDEHQKTNNDLEKLLLQQRSQPATTACLSSDNSEPKITVIEKPLEVDIIKTTS